MTYLIKLDIPRPRGTSRVSCASAQHFTASCLPASPARLWVLVWQGVAAYQMGQPQLLLRCISMKYVLWGLLLDNEEEYCSHFYSFLFFSLLSLVIHIYFNYYTYWSTYISLSYSIHFTIGSLLVSLHIGVKKECQIRYHREMADMDMWHSTISYTLVSKHTP